MSNIDIESIVAAVAPVADSLFSSAPPVQVMGGIIVHTAACASQHFAPWMIEERWFRSAVDAVKNGTLKPKKAFLDGEDDDGPPDGVPYQVHGGTAIIPIVGAIMKKASKYGGTSSVATRSAIRKAVTDDNVHSILLHIDSPGGTVAGTADLAADVRMADGIKPVYAYIEDCGCSAAYWIASQARQISANATAEIGSIGTLMVLDDTSGECAAAGIKVHVISTGKFKGAGVDGAPVTPEQIAMFQTEVDDLNEHFLAGVSEGRDMSMDAVREIADGRAYIAAKAKALGLIDDVSSLQVAFATIMDNEQTKRNKSSISAQPQQQISSAPDEPQRSDTPTPQVALQKGTPMSTPDTAVPAQTPAPVANVTTPEPSVAQLERMTAEGYFEQGRKRGATEGWQNAVDRLKAIQAVCPSKPQMALDYFLTGLSPESAKLAFDDGARLEAKAKEVQDVKDREIARLNALIATGGHSGIPMGFAAADGDEEILDPKVQAEREWDFKPKLRSGFTSKERYVNSRVAELKGQFRSHTASGERV